MYNLFTKNSQSDVTLDGLEQSRLSQKAPAPLTIREEEIAELRKAEVGHSTSVSIDSRSQAISGIKFPMSVAAVTALSKFVDTSEANYVQFYIGITKNLFKSSNFLWLSFLNLETFLLDITKESIELATSDNIPINNLKDQIPKQDARYHLYMYQHKRNGNLTKAICK